MKKKEKIFWSKQRKKGFSKTVIFHNSDEIYFKLRFLLKLFFWISENLDFSSKNSFSTFVRDCSELVYCTQLYSPLFAMMLFAI